MSKKYESNQSINAGHIPACISADLFGAILWLNSPHNMLNYHKHKLLADCYSSLQPSKELLEKYASSLESAKSLGEIDEKKYLFMRTHSMVSDALMNVTKGDYARFTDRTYLDVYEEIKCEAKKEYLVEAEQHNQTKQELNNVIQENSKLAQEMNSLKHEFQKYKDKNEQRELKLFNTTATIIGYIISGILLVVPYVFLLVKLEFIKAKYASQITKGNIIYLTAAVIAGLLLVLIFTQLKKLIIYIVKKIIRKSVQ